MRRAYWLLLGVLLLLAGMGQLPTGAHAQTQIGGPCNTSVVQDGSFEQGSVSGPFTDYAAGQTLGGWTVTSGSVDLVSNALWDPLDGVKSVDLSGFQKGSIAQAVPTQPGQAYKLTFGLAGNPDGSAIKTARVTFGGTVVGTFSFTVSGHGPRSMGWTTHSANVVSGPGTNTVLSFESLTDGPFGPVIDLVTLVPNCGANIVQSSSVSGTLVYSRNDGNHSIWFGAGDGSVDREITAGAWPRLSPNGRLLAFRRIGANGLFASNEIWVRDLSTGTEQMVFRNPTSEIAGYDWTRDSQKLLFDVVCEIDEVNPDGTSLHRFSSGDCFDDAPVVNRVDGRVAFQNLNAGIGLVNADSAGRRFVPGTQPGDMWPAWSPDGQWLSFLRLTSLADLLHGDVWKVHPDGSGLTQLTGFSGRPDDAFGPGAVWTSDDNQVIVPGRVQGIDSLYAVSADGSDLLTRLSLGANAGSVPEFVGSLGSPALVPLALTVFEGVGLLDTPKVQPPLTLSVFEGLAVQDTPKLQPPVTLTLFEGLGLQDTPKVQPPLTLSVFEGLAVQDTPKVRPPVTLTLFEGLGLRDAPAVRPPVALNIGESLHLEDSPGATASNTITILVLPGRAAVLNLPHGHGSIAFPAGLVSAPTLFTYAESIGPAHQLAADQLFAGRSFTLDAADFATGTPRHQLLTNYTLDLTYDSTLLASLGIQPSDLMLTFWNGSAYAAVTDRTLLPRTTTLASRLDHVTEFALVAAAPNRPPDGGPPPPTGEATPELDSLTLLGSGLAGLLTYARARRRWRTWRGAGRS